MLATLLLSRGVPMILGGDEFGRSQLGSNNAYCQDNRLSWLDWTLLEQNRDLFDFVRNCIALRRDEPALRIERFPDDELDEADPWIWLTEQGERMSEADWDDLERRSFGIMIESIGEGPDAWLLLYFNASGDQRTFTFPVGLDASTQRVEQVLSSSLEPHPHFSIPPGTIAVYRVLPA